MDDLQTAKAQVLNFLKTLSTPIASNHGDLAIVLAAGHGKRIKSETSKMLHQVWGKPTVVRVSEAAKRGLKSDNQIIVVGIKAEEVAKAIGKQTNLLFAFQAEQKGTGHAVKIALDELKQFNQDSQVYIFPGDMGLLSADAIAKFKHDFENDKCDMMVLTGVYEGSADENYYGRILRVPEMDISGNPSGDDFGKVIEIKEHKDIQALNDPLNYEVNYNSRTYRFSRKNLVEIREFNTGVFVFKAGPLFKYINSLDTDNVQGELYLTDLISIFNANNLTVRASAAMDNKTVLGFNVKSVLKEMNNYAREDVYNKLKDLITIEDKDDFFIADEVVEQIIALDKSQAPLDISVGKGIYIDKNIKLNKTVHLGNNVRLTGNVILKEGVKVNDNVYISTHENQTLIIGKNTQIFDTVKLKGNVQIGANCRIESFVSMTGNDEYPVRIGNNVTIKGRSYIFGCIVEDDLWIEHSVLKCQHIKRLQKADSSIRKVRYVFPKPEGLEAISNLKNIDESNC